MTMEAEWPFGEGADRNDPLTALRIPCTGANPGWSFLVALCTSALWDAQRPTDREAALVANFIDYKRHYYGPKYRNKMLERPLDVIGGHNTVILLKRGPHDWAYRRSSERMGIMFVPTGKPYLNWPARLDLVPLLCKIATHNGATQGVPNWVGWTKTYPDLYED